PVTVLSRCLQFNLKRLDLGQIEGQITRILEAEDIPFEPGAVRQLAKAADGSLRDGVSLLDQAIAYTGGKLDDAGVATMLGTVDRTRVGALLDALAAGDGERLLAEVETLAGFSPDWGSVLDALAEALHRIQVRQLVPGMAPDVEPEGVGVDALASAVRAEVVQLWYQMALTARRDLPLAPSARAGFEMGVLRMLAFRPAGEGGAPATGGTGSGRSAAEAARAALEPAPPAPVAASRPRPAARTADAASVPAPMPAPSSPAPAAAPPQLAPAAAGPAGFAAESPPPKTAPAAPPAAPASTPVAPAATSNIDAARWPDLVTGLGLRGPVRELGAHTAFVGYENGVLELALPPSDDHLKAPFLVKQLANALAPHFGAAPTIRVSAAAPPEGEPLREREARKRDARQREAESTFLADPDVQRLMSRPGASVVPDSIRPFDDN